MIVLQMFDLKNESIEIKTQVKQKSKLCDLLWC